MSVKPGKAGELLRKATSSSDAPDHAVESKGRRRCTPLHCLEQCFQVMSCSVLRPASLCTMSNLNGLETMQEVSPGPGHEGQPRVFESPLQGRSFVLRARSHLLSTCIVERVQEWCLPHRRHLSAFPIITLARKSCFTSTWFLTMLIRKGPFPLSVGSMPSHLVDKEREDHETGNYRRIILQLQRSCCFAPHSRETWTLLIPV